MNKYELILDTLEKLLKKKSIEEISVSEIAKEAGIAKGSIYYYFKSKDEILYAVIERRYKEPLSVAHNLCSQAKIPPITKMAMVFQACRDSSREFLSSGQDLITGGQQALLHQKYLNYIIKELKPILTEILNQANASGDLDFEDTSALAEIVLIVLTVKLDNTIYPASSEEIARTISGLIKLLEGHAPNVKENLSFLLSE